MNVPQTHIMVDLETASLKDNAAILEIGAVRFYAPVDTPIQKIKIGVSIESLIDISEFDFSKSTMTWWDTQDPQLRAEVFGGAMPIQEALTEFAIWLRTVTWPDSDIILWSKGADFDCKILETAFEICDIEFPVDFRNYRCARTMMAQISPTHLAKIPPNTRKHDALADAIYQAAVCEHMLDLIDSANGV